MPFDLVAAYSGFDKTLDLLENDFKGYFDNLVALDVNSEENKTRCLSARREHPEGKVMFVNNNLKSNYIHDGGLTREEFIQRYTDRINNVQKVICESKHIFFFVARYDSVNLQAQIERCCSVLDKICKQVHSLIVYAPYDLSLSVDRKDVLILKKGCRADYVSEFGSYIDDMGVRHRNATEPGMPAFANVTTEVKNFIDRRLKETNLCDRKAEIDTSAALH